jgi:hypothetical protein
MSHAFAKASADLESYILTHDVSINLDSNNDRNKCITGVDSTKEDPPTTDDKVSKDK